MNGVFVLVVSSLKQSHGDCEIWNESFHKLSKQTKSQTRTVQICMNERRQQKKCFSYIDKEELG